MNATERRIVAEFEHAITTGEPARLRPSELRHLHTVIPPSLGPQGFAGGAIGPPLNGVSIVVENPPGYPTKVTPRARKKRRR